MIVIEIKPDAADAWATLEAEHGATPPTYEMRSPEGGRLIFFTGDAPASSELAPGVRLLTGGDFVREHPGALEIMSAEMREALTGHASQSVELLHGKELDALMDDDRAWFDARPGRRFRLRRAWPFEFEPVSRKLREDDYTLVAQLGPGVRIRQHFRALPHVHAQWTQSPALVDEAPDWAVERLFRQFASPDAVALIDKGKA